MRRLRIVAWLATALLAACGGGSQTITGAASSSTSQTASVATVAVAASPSTIAVDGSTTSTVTATALDANNAGIVGASVTFSSSAGGAVAVVSATTDANGKATATLSNLSAAAGTNLTVSAKVGGKTGSATVGVIAIQQALSLQTDQPQIPSDSSKPATISAVLRDANNNALAGATVRFSATSGVLAVTQAVTDANGVAKATLTAGTDPTNRTITVTANSGSASAQVAVTVTGTTLTLTGPANLVLNNSGSCSVVLTNSAGQGIPNITVTLSSATGNVLSASTVTTDSSGRASFTLRGTTGGVDTITATAQGLTQKISVTVSTQSFNVTAPADGTKVNLGIPQTVTVTWLNNGTPVVGQLVTFAATRGTLTPSTPVTTDANGKASVSISSGGAGPSIVVASGTGVSAQLNLDFVAILPSQISVQAGPAAVAVQGQSTISALVRDAANNLVEGATVNFQVTTDPTNGQLSVASATTDAQGRAQTVYTAGNSSSGANGVTVTATVAATAITDSATLTVGGQAVFLSLGTGNTIDVSQGVAIYQVTYTVFAVDSQGAALANVPVTVSILPVAYGKGVMGGCPSPGPDWSPVYSTATSDPDAYNGSKFCGNEDTDYTGNINSLGSAGGIPLKDYNQNGKLDPGNVAVVSPSTGTTDSHGRLDVNVTYPRDHAYWVAVTLQASTKVQGTESSTSSTFVLQGAVADYACSVGPPGATSPYGVASTCANKN
ncbi:MAG: Ig-like domain-containing protein [Pseudomonadota bacterium]|nr:Ig-like domain-containing protein [Pseudomonadota bacterium]